MAVRFYDEALVNKIQKWIKDPHMVVLKPNEVSRLWQVRADQKNDEPLTLPLIAVSRDPNLNISVATKRNLTFDGLKIGKGENVEKDSIQLDAIPIEINYQIDIYTRKYDEGDEYLRNFIFNFVNYPQMKVLLPYNGANIEHVCYTRLSSSVVDNSDISEKLFPDQFTRWTIQLTVHDAFLFGIPVKESARIVGADFEMVDNMKQAVPIVPIEVESADWNGELPEIDSTNPGITGTGDIREK